MASEEKIASATRLRSRSCRACASGIGRPTRTRLSRATLMAERPSLQGGGRRVATRPESYRISRLDAGTQQVRDIRDDRVAAEEQRALEQKRRLVVQDVLPPPTGDELGQHHRHHVIRA